MDTGFTVTAKRDGSDTATLTLRYPSKEYALAAVSVIQAQWPVVTLTDPDGVILARESNTH
jgi:hypothetical protein